MGRVPCSVPFRKLFHMRPECGRKGHYWFLLCFRRNKQRKRTALVRLNGLWRRRTFLKAALDRTPVRAQGVATYATLGILTVAWWRMSTAIRVMRRLRALYRYR